MSVGAKSQGVFGVETLGAGYRPSTWYGLRFKKFNFLPKPTPERTMNIDPRGQLLKARIGKWDLPWNFDAELSVNDLARLRTHHQGWATITNPAAGVYQWAIRDLLSSDTVVTDMSNLSFEVDRDDSYATLLIGAQVQDWAMKFAAGKILDHTFSGLALNHTHMADPALTTTTGTFTGTCYVRNNRHDSDSVDPTNANPIKFKCITAGALGTAQFRFTTGATAYAGPNFTLSAGVWQDVILGNGTYVSGDPLDNVQIMMTGSGAFALNDEFTVNAGRVKVASPVYPANNPLSSVGASFSINGSTYYIESGELKFGRPKKDRRACGSKYPIAILPNGTRQWSLKINRDYTDRDMYRLLLSQTAVPFTVTCLGDLIATVAGSSYYEKHVISSTNAQVIMAGANVDSDKQLPESIELVPYWDGTNVDVTETITTSLSTLT